MTEAGNNYSEKKTQLHISVRNLVEFIFREGDIDNRSSRAMSADAMMEGTRIHRKIQGSMGKEYQAEVPLSLVVEGDLYELTVEGRADGIFTEDGKCFVDEIKGMYRRVELFEKPVFVHRAQAMCYAYIFALQNNMETIGIQMTYCNLETEQTKYFREEFSFEEIKKWFDDLMEEYGKWATFQCEMKNQRQASIKELNFPFEYRPGQKKLVSDVYRTIMRQKLLFMQAPTGVGKTYLAKKLAEYMFGSADALIRIDMSEYSESFNTSRLVGAPPGYVGYEEGGQLTEKVRRHPYSIVLLDEIEKAHGNVYNMLLQVLDEGRLTDGNGRLIDFRNTVIIMTSNAGTRQLKEFGRGGGFNAGSFSADMKDSDKEYARSIIQKSLSKQFSPEFLNRLDEIITFDQLDLEAIKKIIDIELKGLVKRIQDMGYNITLTDKAKEFVATKGYDVQFGARPLKRAIQTYIEDGICELMLSGELKEGCTISVGKNPNKEELTFKTTEQQAE